MSRAGCRPVLVVEDDRDVLDAVVEVLEEHGYVPLRAANGIEALERARNAEPKPCLILLDVMMPVMDGPAFRVAQQADPTLDRIPVVVLTAHANVEAAAREMKAAGWLKKPVRLAQLIDTVRQYCQEPGGQ